MIPTEQQTQAAQARITAYASLSNADKCDALDYREAELENLCYEDRDQIRSSERAAEKLTYAREMASYPLHKIDEFSSQSSRDLHDAILSAKQQVKR